ncbi:MAG TPA: hypothetical protein VF698_13275 [Thermoanaerobaculia bacterium]
MIRRLALALTLLAALPAVAATEYPPFFRWQTIATEHFFIHFHQGEEELARRAAAIAEEVHVRLTARMDWTPRARTHLVLTDHVDVSNGSATTFPRNRIEVFVSAPGGDPSSPLEFYDNWLSLVIAHEYAHILHLDQARGLPAFLRKVLGRHPAAFPNQYVPLWMTEGLATLIESEETDAGRLKGTFVDMVLRTAAIENRWRTAAQAGGLTAQWPGGNARYFFGSKFLQWVERRYGREALARYFTEFSTNVIPYRVNATAEDVFGTEMSSLYEQWSREQQQVYREEHARLATRGFTARERITELGYETKYPEVSPDGTRVAYAHRGPYEDASIRVRETSGTAGAAPQRERTLRVNTISPLSWSPDGTTIAFAQLEYHRTFSLLSDLWLWRVGGEAKRLTRGARLKDPAFAPDGKTLIAVQNEAGRNRLVEVDAATGAIRPLVEPDEVTQFSEPTMRGERIAVAEWRAGRIDVVLYARDGRRLENVTQSLPRATYASPAFDGEAILFSGDADGVANIYVWRNGEIQRITNVYGGAFFPAAHGERVYFADYHAGGFDIASFARGAAYEVTPRVAERALERRIEDVEPKPAAAGARRSRGIAPAWWSPLLGDGEAGFTTSGGDVLGIHTYSVTALFGDETRYGAAYSYDGWYPTVTLAASRSSDTRRVLAQVSAPYRRWRWQSLGYAAAIRDELAGIGTLTGARAGLVFNNTRTFGFSISRENGVLARVDYEHLGGDASTRQLRTDLRGYRSFGRHVLAARVAAGRNEGDFIPQRELRVGGVSEGEFIAAGSRDFPVRGYALGTLRGKQAALASLEYRLPLFDIDRGPGVWPLFFHRVFADVFADAGTAWDRNDVRRSIASAGAEASIDVVFGYFAPFRWRAGVAYRLNGGGVEPYVALSSSF